MIRRFIGGLAVVAIAMAPLVAPCVIGADAADGCLTPDCGERGPGMDEGNCCCTDSRPSAPGHSGPAGVALPPVVSAFIYVQDDTPGALSSSNGRSVAWLAVGRPIHLLNSTFLI